VSVAVTTGLPPLDTPFALPAGLPQQFRRDGHAVVRGLASPAEVAAYGEVISQAARTYSTETLPLAERDTYGKAFLQVMNLWRLDAGVQQFVMAERFAEVAADLLGVPAVRLYHDQALFKEPGGGPTPFHQDHHYWPFEGSGAVTMWMPLCDVPAEIGSLNFVSGSQDLGFVGEYEISDESEQVFADLIAETGLEVVTHGAMTAGDATFHHSWMLHGAPPNPSQSMRSVMTVIYVADDSTVIEPTSEARSRDLERWLPGLVPGDRVASPINPLLYSAS
jgi:ectoine hydroxylase-related dioxygenase (phytanoyl-CoA dioxygenase family)